MSNRQRWSLTLSLERRNMSDWVSCRYLQGLHTAAPRRYIRSRFAAAAAAWTQTSKRHRGSNSVLRDDDDPLSYLSVSLSARDTSADRNSERARERARERTNERSKKKKFSRIDKITTSLRAATTVAVTKANKANKGNNSTRLSAARR